MKAISLTQPWAHLVMLGAKQWETRSWSTTYRGQIAIHASKNYPGSAQSMEREPFYKEALYLNGWQYTYPSLSCGRIIALAEIVDCQPTENFRQEGFTRRDSDPPYRYIEIPDSEFRFGDFSAGRFAFKLEKILRIPQIECKGALGIWNVPDLIAAQILDDLKHLQREEASMR